MNSEEIFYILLSILSFLSGLLLPLLFFKYKKCRPHPSEIFFGIAICECITTYHLLIISLKPSEYFEAIHLNESFRNFIFKYSKIIFNSFHLVFVYNKNIETKLKKK